ncbi:hypothetical protein CJD36_022430 [Flavipsychrobacter stenotrophus]|uniref:Putative beta-lactamase-inhibitor-like PepSY-like domain-containing protein n=1 Tax=Flavipsychrobacter stenotrophus TaxID=2077091 RepID=A0A2S7SPI8_9BACT|nr:PepSY-like domain-containing protein [Flavipsychrobacter stenotrophus]PQJ08813.1 hypothetical protein CJD36_022430 [Flavipsychrobacter stenotrophus]
MKKLIIIAGIGLMGATAVYAQKINESKVPAAAKNAFMKQFPGVNAKWEKEGADFEAGFDKGGKKMSAVFASDGSWKETETSIAVSALPTAAQQYVKKNYPSEKIKEAAEIKKANGSIVYEAEIKGGDLLFDQNGTFIKSSKD